MVGEAPDFWWNEQKLMRWLLLPVSWIYGYFARRRMERENIPVIDLPVLCVGNFTLGGTGKTPVVISLADAAKKLGLHPGIVSRGYGGEIRSAHLVDSEFDKAREVGDEPLLLARHAPVAAATDRLEAAKLLQQQGCNLILMDDGFQSRRLFVDYALMVVDGLRGLGNNAVFPAGPLRAPLVTQLAYTDGVLMIGNGDKGNEVIHMAARAAKPLNFAHLVPSATDAVSGKKFLAFAGIGNPQKFFRSIGELGGKVEQTRIFADHHFYTDFDLDDIIDSAKAKHLFIATTAKDFARLKTDGQDKKLENLVVFDVEVQFDDPDFCGQRINEALEAFRNRSNKE